MRQKKGQRKKTRGLLLLDSDWIGPFWRIELVDCSRYVNEDQYYCCIQKGWVSGEVEVRVSVCVGRSASLAVLGSVVAVLFMVRWNDERI